jgi:hypothetical protein
VAFALFIIIIIALLSPLQRRLKLPPDLVPHSERRM